jgi:predicted ThiF/HesA family dinucleotide-utilizing enzyme
MLLVNTYTRDGDQFLFNSSLWHEWCCLQIPFVKRMQITTDLLLHGFSAEEKQALDKYIESQQSLPIDLVDRNKLAANLNNTRLIIEYMQAVVTFYNIIGGDLQHIHVSIDSVFKVAFVLCNALISFLTDNPDSEMVITALTLLDSQEKNAWLIDTFRALLWERGTTGYKCAVETIFDMTLVLVQLFGPTNLGGVGLLDADEDTGVIKVYTIAPGLQLISFRFSIVSVYRGQPSSPAIVMTLESSATNVRLITMPVLTDQQLYTLDVPATQLHHRIKAVEQLLSTAANPVTPENMIAIKTQSDTEEEAKLGVLNTFVDFIDPSHVTDNPDLYAKQRRIGSCYAGVNIPHYWLPFSPTMFLDSAHRPMDNVFEPMTEKRLEYDPSMVVLLAGIKARRFDVFYFADVLSTPGTMQTPPGLLKPSPDVAILYEDPALATFVVPYSADFLLSEYNDDLLEHTVMVDHKTGDLIVTGLINGSLDYSFELTDPAMIAVVTAEEKEDSPLDFLHRHRPQLWFSTCSTYLLPVLDSNRCPHMANTMFGNPTVPAESIKDPLLSSYVVAIKSHILRCISYVEHAIFCDSDVAGLYVGRVPLSTASEGSVSIIDRQLLPLPNDTLLFFSDVPTEANTVKVLERRKKQTKQQQQQPPHKAQQTKKTATQPIDNVFSLQLASGKEVDIKRDLTVYTRTKPVFVVKTSACFGLGRDNVVNLIALNNSEAKPSAFAVLLLKNVVPNPNTVKHLLVDYLSGIKSTVPALHPVPNKASDRYKIDGKKILFDIVKRSLSTNASKLDGYATELEFSSTHWQGVLDSIFTTPLPTSGNITDLPPPSRLAKRR